MKTIAYRSGYKYQLAEMFSLAINIFPAQRVETEFIDLSPEGVLIIKSGYSWDGPSGPTIDTKSSMRASLVHDALYQLIRNGHLPASQRAMADSVFYDICLQDGMWKWRAYLWFRELRKFAAGAASPKNKKRVIFAPTKPE